MKLKSLILKLVLTAFGLGGIFFGGSLGTKLLWAYTPSLNVSNLKVQADLLLKAGRVKDAIPLYEEVLKQDGKFANAHYNLATAYYLTNKFEKAAACLEAFVRLSPSDAEAFYNLGCLKLRLGAFREAEDCFSRASQSPSRLSRKIEEALRFTKGLREQPAETQKVLAYLLS